MPAFMVPALRKLHEGRGTHRLGDAAEVKGSATRQSFIRERERCESKNCPHASNQKARTRPHRNSVFHGTLLTELFYDSR